MIQKFKVHVTPEPACISKEFGIIHLKELIYNTGNLCMTQLIFFSLFFRTTYKSVNFKVKVEELHLII